jgi:hypothetical protein
VLGANPASGPLNTLIGLVNAHIAAGGAGDYNADVRAAHEALSLAGTSGSLVTAQTNLNTLDTSLASSKYTGPAAPPNGKAATYKGTPAGPSLSAQTGAATTYVNSANTAITNNMPNTAALEGNMANANSAYTNLGSPPSQVRQPGTVQVCDVCAPQLYGMHCHVSLCLC